MPRRPGAVTRIHADQVARDGVRGGALAGARGGFVRLEQLVATPPDLILVTTQATAPGDQGEALLAHPALAALYPPDRRILLPERLTVCGGPSLPEAIDWLASEARRVTEGP